LIIVAPGFQQGYAAPLDRDRVTADPRRRHLQRSDSQVAEMDLRQQSTRLKIATYCNDPWAGAVTKLSGVRRPARTMELDCFRETAMLLL
jgi:hypothetical protein